MRLQRLRYFPSINFYKVSYTTPHSPKILSTIKVVTIMNPLINSSPMESIIGERKLRHYCTESENTNESKLQRKEMKSNSGVITSDRAKIGRKYKGKSEMRRVDFTPFLICFCNLVAGVYNLVRHQGEVSSPLIILGGSSAIFFVFFATNYEERSLSLLSFIFNNVIIFYVLQVPDPYIFLVALFLIFLSIFHIFIFMDSDLFLDFLFLAVLLCRIFFHPIMGEWGFGLVTELMFLGIFSFFFDYRSGEGSRIEPLLYLVPLFIIAFFNLFYLYNGLKDILIHILFLFAAASLIYFSFHSDTIIELKISLIFYIISNLSLGYILSNSVETFYEVSAGFLVSLITFALFFIMKAERDNKPLAYILFSNNREGIHNCLVIYFLILGGLLIQLNPAALYSNWLLGLGIQIGYLTLFNYYFKK